MEAIEPGAGGMFFDWLGRARSSLDLGVKAFIEQDSTSVLDFLNPGRVLALALKVNPLELLLSQSWQMSNYFKQPKLKALFSFQELYVGLTPYNAPGVFSLLAATELTDGVWYPKGGFQTVRDALLKITTRLGVTLRAETTVAEILLEDAGAEGAKKTVRRLRCIALCAAHIASRSHRAAWHRRRACVWRAGRCCARTLWLRTRTFRTCTVTCCPRAAPPSRPRRRGRMAWTTAPR